GLHSLKRCAMPRLRCCKLLPSAIGKVSWCLVQSCPIRRRNESATARPVKLTPVPRGRSRHGHGGLRIVVPNTKLATTPWWKARLPAGIATADEDGLYAAMDWLLERQDAIERKLAPRDLKSGELQRQDLSAGGAWQRSRRQEGQAAAQLWS